jgi:Flp pilus assembly protein TadG
MAKTTRHPFKLGKHQGQNLVELAISFPLLLVTILGVVEVGRAWNTYEGTRLAAMDGAYTAAIYKNKTLGETQITTRLTSANIPLDRNNAACGGAGAQVIETNGEFTVNVCTRFVPIFGDMGINFMGDEITVFPAAIPISYQNVQTPTIY